jgi:hypothetical protein
VLSDFIRDVGFRCSRFFMTMVAVMQKLSETQLWRYNSLNTNLFIAGVPPWIINPLSIKRTAETTFIDL